MDYEKSIPECLRILVEKRIMAKEESDRILSELAESEDERIRKEIIQFLQLPHPQFVGKRNHEEWIAYLEKQKDERELSFIEGKLEGVRQTCQEIKDAMSLFEPKDLTPFEFTFRDYIDSAIRYCLAGEGYQQYIKEWAADLLNLERQKEQQPAEWNDTDMKEARNNLISVCRDWEFGKQTTLLPVAAVRARHFLEHLTEPKPAEWSEEDKKIVEEVIDVLNAYRSEFLARYSKSYVTDLINKLKSLHPLTMQEWSEDDIDKMVNARAKKSGTTESEMEFYRQGVKDTLKSLQPHWKPSEEQMEALFLVSGVGAQKHRKTLKSLYNDLKSL